MVCDSAEGVYLFLYRDTADGPCAVDELFPSIEEARQRAAELMAVEHADWEAIEDARPGCQQDWIAPVRIKRDAGGAPEYGKFERLEAGRWIETSPSRGL